VKASQLFVAVFVAFMVMFTPVVNGIYSTATGVVTIVNPPGDTQQEEDASSLPEPMFINIIGKAEAHGPGWVYDRLHGWTYVGQYVSLEYQQAAGQWNNFVNYVRDPYIGYSPHVDY
jgi:hypothetical protein